MLSVLGATHIGSMRAENQDTYLFGLVDEQRCYGGVCDGMGGENAGGYASQLARQALCEALEKAQWSEITPQNVKHLLVSAAVGANSRINEQAHQNPHQQGKGTTQAHAVILQDTLYCVHAGDSRIYTIADDTIKQLTVDHTVVQFLIDSGELTAAAAENHPQRHFITRALGVAEQIDLEYGEYPLDGQQYVVLATDGLYNSLQPEQIIDFTRQAVARRDAQLLVDAANEYGGSDNITAVIIQLQ